MWPWRGGAEGAERGRRPKRDKTTWGGKERERLTNPNRRLYLPPLSLYISPSLPDFRRWTVCISLYGQGERPGGIRRMQSSTPGDYTHTEGNTGGEMNGSTPRVFSPKWTSCRNRRRFFSVRGSEGCVCMGLSLEGGKTRWKEGGVGNRLEEEEGSGGN